MTLGKKLKANNLYIVLILAAVLYIILAYTNKGYYHADEHFQIVEFAGYKLGTHTADNLAWEFRSQIRSTLQPTICYFILKGFIGLGIDNPYIQLFGLRLLTAILSLIFISYFIKVTKNLFIDKKLYVIYVILSYFICFIPFISIRFSSETWSGLFFLFSLALFLSNKKEKKKPFIVGFMLGISFLFRYQIAFAFFGFILWLIIINRKGIIFLVKLICSFFIIVFLGTLIDTWFYGEFVFAPLNYFKVNIIDDVASSFGTSPWYYYLKLFVIYPNCIIGIPLLASIFLLLIFNSKNIFLWCIIPFFIAHSLVGHKEFRFLFSIFYLFPFILLMGYQQLMTIIKKTAMKKAINYLLLLLIIPVNTIEIICSKYKCDGFGYFTVSEDFYHRFYNARVNLISCSYSDPYNPFGLPVKFIENNNVIQKPIGDICDLNESLIKRNVENFLVIRKAHYEREECIHLIDKYHFKVEKQYAPLWIEKLNKKFPVFDNNNMLILFRYSPEE